MVGELLQERVILIELGQHVLIEILPLLLQLSFRQMAEIVVSFTD